ncbi:hypothetical protein SLA2020_172490 [Shorea laevis]
MPHDFHVKNLISRTKAIGASVGIDEMSESCSRLVLLAKLKSLQLIKLKFEHQTPVFLNCEMLENETWKSRVARWIISNQPSLSPFSPISNIMNLSRGKLKNSFAA